MPTGLPNVKVRWSYSFFKAVIISIIALIGVLVILRRITSFVLTDVDIVLFILTLLLLGLLYLGKKGFHALSGILLVSFVWLGCTYIMWTGKGIYDAVVVAYLAVILIASLMLDWKFSILFLLATFSSIWLNVFLQLRGQIVPESRDPIIIYTRDVTIIMFAVAVLSLFYLRQMNDNLKQIANELYERKRIERALRASEENYKLLFDQAAEGIVISNFSGDILLTNESFARISGYAKQELEGRNISILFEPEELAKKPARYDLVDKNEIVIRKRNLLRKNGKTVEVESRTKKLPDGRLQAFISDISQRTNAEKTLKDFERIFNLSANPICVTHVDGTLLKINPAFSTCLGYPVNKIEGKLIFDFMHTDDIEKTKTYVRKKIKEKASLLHLENRYLARDGSVVWLSWMTQPIYEENISFSVAHDITHIKQVERELIAAKEKAEESDRLKTAFLENMSHEIRTPMNGIIGFSEMFTDTNLTENERNHYAQIVINSGQKLLSILDDILDISRIETGQIEIVPEPVNINEQADELYQFFFTKAKDKKLEFKIEKALPDEEATIYTDRTRLHQILSNLLANAFKFTKQGHVCLGYREEDGFLSFYIEDTGIGIDEKMHQIIFERFRQANAEVTKNYGGTGLGLSISQKLVSLLGGKIGLESMPGKGSKFFFTIPFVPYKSKQKPGSAGKLNMPKNTGKGVTILVVEDDQLSYDYLNELLSKSGHKVIRASDGIQAIQIAEENDDLKLVLMDIKLPVMNGYEATRQIKMLRPKLPVVAQTAFAMSSDRGKALEAGCDDYITKPIVADNLIRIINKFTQQLI
jgi:PAS domain S-box-containing protein